MSNRILIMNRGDTLKLKIEINNLNNLKYKLQEDDTLYFGLMDPHQRFEEALLKKKFTLKDANPDGSIMIEIKPADTLDLYPGIYYYALKIHRYSEVKNIDEVITIINKTKFIIND